MNQKVVRKLSLFLILAMIIGIFQGREVFAAPKNRVVAKKEKVLKRVIN